VTNLDHGHRRDHAFLLQQLELLQPLQHTLQPRGIQRAELRQHGVWTVALETVAHAPCVGEIPWRFPCAVVLGNERFGLDPGTVAACDGTARIPAYGTKNSLNVVTAFAICAWDARRVWNQGV